MEKSHNIDPLEVGVARYYRHIIFVVGGATYWQILFSFFCSLKAFQMTIWCEAPTLGELRSAVAVIFLSKPYV